MLKTDVAHLLLEKYGKKNPPVVKPGDTVKVHQKIKEGDKERVQVFEGLVIALKHGRGLNGTFTVRKIAVGGIGVERTYPLHSPNVVKVERTKTAQVSRAKLYYMRDRKGKTARFKNEAASPLAWQEPDVIIELPVEEAPEVIEETITEEVIAEAEPVTEEAPANEEVDHQPEEEKGGEEVAIEDESIPAEEEVVKEKQSGEEGAE
jgi:large subunit ribosomal protein L19